ncbi:MAG: hypothetical protein FJ379_10510 [Verrucomicrobia bacterium]|nr:hypothetical protein [Verrucomicrobiota bacterium]
MNSRPSLDVFPPRTGMGVVSRCVATRVAVTLSILLGFSSLDATQIPSFSLRSITERADRVVHGRVESIETVKGGDGRLRTRVEVVVDDTWKGPAEPRVTVVQASGVLGERWVRVVGEPEFRPGEEVVLFLVRTPAGDWVVAPLSQGKFSVTRDAEGVRVGNGILGVGGAKPMGLQALREEVCPKVQSGGAE